MAKKSCYFCKAHVIRTIKEKARVIPDLKLAYICDTCLKGYWCLCEPHGLCHDLCKRCDAKCFEICECEGRILAPPRDGVPHHWLRRLKTGYYGGGPYGTAARVSNLKKMCKKVLDGTLKPEDAFFWIHSRYFTENGISVEEETRVGYLTDKEYKVILKRN